jgi:hypothetical protein
LKKITSILIIFFLAVSCLNNNSTESDSIINETTKENKYFKGIIRFKETYNNINENISKSLITITVDGESVKRETKSYHLGILDKTVGIVSRNDQDSVYYYNIINKKTHSVAIAKADYLIWVQTRLLPTDSLKNESHYKWDIPFGDIFSPLEDQPNISVKIAKKISIMKLENCELMTLLFDKNKTCTIGYCKDINVSPNILALTENNQPKTLKTIALNVSYNSIEKNMDKLDKILSKTNQLGKPIIQYEGHQSQEKPLIELPKGAINCKPSVFDAIVSPKEEPSSSSTGNHHHHDFF